MLISIFNTLAPLRARSLRRSALLCGLSLLILAWQPAGSARATSLCDSVTGNLISNCGFETQPVGGGNVPPGWTTAQWTGEEQITTNPVHSGTYALRIANDENQGGPLFNGAAILSQTFADISGQSYDFNFYLVNGATAGGTGIQFQAFWDSTSGTPLLDITNSSTPTAWTEYSFNVTGTGSDTITFTSYNNPNWFYLDDVEVVSAGKMASAAPEPTSEMLVGFGFLGLVAGCWRRNSRRSSR